jgi:thymidylate synthase (FAD)
MTDEHAYPDYPVEVKLLAVTGVSSTDLMGEGFPSSLPECLIEYAGRLCYDTQEHTGETPDRIQKWIQAGHESMVEHSSATFYIRASRVLTHELVRHRIASYSQRSQRYVKEHDARYISPEELSEGHLSQVFQSAMQSAWAAYGVLLRAGVKPEIARYVLPNACETQIITTMNFRELRHFIKLRTSPRALPEMRCVAGKIRELCKEIAPQVFEDL